MNNKRKEKIPTIKIFKKVKKKNKEIQSIFHTEFID
jgi:hypothetical protein